jgi:hypothetical protein
MVTIELTACLVWPLRWLQVLIDLFMNFYRWWYDIYLCFVDALHMAKYYIYALILKCENEIRTQMYMALQSDKRTYERFSSTILTSYTHW